MLEGQHKGLHHIAGRVIHRPCPQACVWLWGFVGCRHSTCAQHPLSTRAPGEHPCRRLPAQAATHLDATSLDTEFWLKIRDNHPISRARPLDHPEAEPPDSCHSTFLIAMQLEHGHDQVRRARGGPVLSTVLHRREADLWITRQGMIRHPPLRAVRGGCRIRGRQTASSESMAERKTPRPSVPVRGPACESGPKPGSTACSGWGMSPTTLPRSLRTPAMSRAEPLGLPT